MTSSDGTRTGLTTYARDGAVAVITLNRPERRNALTAELLVSLKLSLDEAERDPEVRAILLTGAGNAFCAGQDLNDRDPRKVAWPLPLARIQEQYFHPVVLAMQSSCKPIVVAVNGAASGAGVSLALAGDIVMAAEDAARFIFSFVKVGLSVDAGCGWHLVKSVGRARALALLLSGAAVSASEALELGLIWRCVPDADLEAAALAVTRQLAAGPTAAFGLVKQAVAFADSLPLEDYLLQEARLQGLAGASQDNREGVLSFLERRAARFIGR